jgi:hypothetical protein
LFASSIEGTYIPSPWNGIVLARAGVSESSVCQRAGAAAWAADWTRDQRPCVHASIGRRRIAVLPLPLDKKIQLLLGC